MIRRFVSWWRSAPWEDRLALVSVAQWPVTVAVGTTLSLLGVVR